MARGGNSQDVTKLDLERWARRKHQQMNTGRPFCNESFELGFQKMDTNGDGNVNFEEIVACVVRSAKEKNIFVE